LGGGTGPKKDPQREETKNDEGLNLETFGNNGTEEKTTGNRWPHKLWKGYIFRGRSQNSKNKNPGGGKFKKKRRKVKKKKLSRRLKAPLRLGYLGKTLRSVRGTVPHHR